MGNDVSNFTDLRDQCREARAALSRVRPPTPEQDNPLYYPLLFLAETAESVLRHTLKEAYSGVQDENEGAARFLADARKARA